MAAKRPLADVAMNGDSLPVAKQPRKSYAARASVAGTRRTDHLSIPDGLVACPHPGCSRTMKQTLIEQHISICPMNPLHRRLEANKQATERLARRSMAAAKQKQQRKSMGARKSMGGRKSVRPAAIAEAAGFVYDEVPEQYAQPEVQTPCLSDDDEPRAVTPEQGLSTTIAPPNLGAGLFNFSPGGGFDLGASPPPVDLPEFPDKRMVAKVSQATPPPPPARTLEEARFEYKLEKQRKRQDTVRQEEAKSTEPSFTTKSFVVLARC